MSASEDIARENALSPLRDKDGEQWIDPHEITDRSAPYLIAARDVLLLLARLEQRVDAGEPGEGVRQKPDVVEAGDCACDGSGKIVDHFTGDPNHWVDISNGLQMGAPSGYSSRLCSCRKSLPKRDGEATWWGSSEAVFEEIVEFALFHESATVSVGVETCISEDNYLVHRTKENAYYPCQISLEVSETNLSWLMPDDLRSLAAALLRAADKCDEIDGPLASTTPPEAAPVPGSPDLASLVSSLTAERDDALTTLRRVVANESNHYDRYWTPAPKPLTEEWLVATEAKMREALTDVFCDDAAAVMLELIAEIRHLQSAIRALYGTDVWWLIERGQPEGQAPTMWVTANNYEYAGFEWTEDANKAMRWSLKDGAEEYIAEHFTHPVRGPSARAVEHAWFTR